MQQHAGSTCPKAARHGIEQNHTINRSTQAQTAECVVDRQLSNISCAKGTLNRLDLNQCLPNQEVSHAAGQYPCAMKPRAHNDAARIWARLLVRATELLHVLRKSIGN